MAGARERACGRLRRPAGSWGRIAAARRERVPGLDRQGLDLHRGFSSDLGFLVRSRATGQLRLPAADGRISLVSRADVARCLAALAVAPASGRHHDITGPQSLDLAKIAALATREWGTPLEYARITPSEHCTEMAITGEDPWWMYAYSTMFASIREQRWAASLR